MSLGRMNTQYDTSAHPSLGERQRVSPSAALLITRDGRGGAGEGGRSSRIGRRESRRPQVYCVRKKWKEVSEEK